jgi:hypothetical protein
MQDNKTNPAAEYAAAIVEEVQALDRLVGGLYARRDASLQEFWDDCETIGVSPEALEDGYADALGAWLDNCLAVEVFVGSVRRDARRVEVLRTCGGPHCEITRSNDDGAAVTVTVHDGHDTATVRIYPANVAGALDEFADSFEEVAR